MLNVFRAVKGIYRVNGAKSRVEKLCQAFENGKHLVELSELYPHDISNVLKLYLRQVGWRSNVLQKTSGLRSQTRSNQEVRRFACLRTNCGIYLSSIVLTPLVPCLILSFIYQLCA